MNKLNLNLLLIFIGIIILSGCQTDNLDYDVPVVCQNEYAVSQDAAFIIAGNIPILEEKKDGLSFLKRKSDNPKKVESVTTVPDGNGGNSCYIINYEGGGFVILAADKRLTPVLAFSETSKFILDETDIPDGIIGWLHSVKDCVDETRTNNLKPDEFIEKEWGDIMPVKMKSAASRPKPIGDGYDVEIEEVGPLLTTNWHQRTGFNSMLKTGAEIGCSNLNRALAGCVPIAMAQVMKYHKHPALYNWNLMPDNVASSETARLIKDMHSVLPVNYKCDATGIDRDYDKAKAFRNIFNYSSASKGDYDSDVVVANLRHKFPVLLSGGTDSGWWIFHNYTDGHMWVCDGFRRTILSTLDEYGNLIHSSTRLHLYMNWGWGKDGKLNGWYAFDNFNPGTDTFNYDNKMVYNIRP